MRGFDEVENGFFEVWKRGIIAGMQAAFFHQPPEAFDQVELRRIGRQKQQFDVQVGGGLLHQPATLVPSVVQHHRDRHGQAQRRQLVQHPADVLAVDIGVGGDGEQLMGHRVQGPQHAESVAAGGGRLPATGQAPQPTQEKAVDEVGGVQKNTARWPVWASRRRGASAAASKVACSARRSSVGAGPGIALVLRRRNPNCLSTLPTWAGLRSIPVSSVIRFNGVSNISLGLYNNALNFDRLLAYQGL